jgi:hypothetical protein
VLLHVVASTVVILQFEQGRLHGERLQAARLFEIVEAFVNADQRVLHQIVHVRLGPDAFDEVAPQNGLQPAEQPVSSLFVAVLGLSNAVRIERRLRHGRKAKRRVCTGEGWARLSSPQTGGRNADSELIDLRSV